MARFFIPRQRADEAGYDTDPIGKRSFMRGYQDGYASASSPPFPPRPVAYRKGYAVGRADAKAFEDAAAVMDGNPAVERLRAGLKNVRRTTTRRLDDAGMPEDMQGNDGRDWG